MNHSPATEWWSIVDSKQAKKEFNTKCTEITQLYDHKQSPSAATAISGQC